MRFVPRILVGMRRGYLRRDGEGRYRDVKLTQYRRSQLSVGRCVHTNSLSRKIDFTPTCFTSPKNGQTPSLLYQPLSLWVRLVSLTESQPSIGCYIMGPTEGRRVPTVKPFDSNDLVNLVVIQGRRHHAPPLALRCVGKT